MSCNISAYLEEQQIVCLRIARASNEGTDAQKEWLKTAQVLINRAKDHQRTCKKCKEQSVSIAEKH